MQSNVNCCYQGGDSSLCIAATAGCQLRSKEGGSGNATKSDLPFIWTFFFAASFVWSVCVGRDGSCVKLARNAPIKTDTSLNASEDDDDRQSFSCSKLTWLQRLRCSDMYPCQLYILDRY